MRNILAIGVVATALIATGAMAQTLPANVYGSIGVTQHSNDYDTTSISGRIGTQLTPHIGIEAEGGLGVNDDSKNGIKYKNKGAFGAYLTARAPVAPKFDILGRIGYVNSWTEKTTSTQKFKNNSDDSFAVGIGAEYKLNPVNSIRADYTRFTDNDTDNFGLSLVHKF